ncbi:MAG TPA: hypothetical protein DEP05_06445 [Betaproteobacteria bacterium]|nr:hypothetical protein [Betaproteobacteria bacterium]
MPLKIEKAYLYHEFHKKFKNKSAALPRAAASAIGAIGLSEAAGDFAARSRQTRHSPAADEQTPRRR